MHEHGSSPFQSIYPARNSGCGRRAGQERLSRAHAALIGAGALGSTIADLLVRAGIGRLTLIDRDYVELHNLQRQTLYTEDDVRDHTPKAMAAAERLSTINSSVEIRPVVADVNSLSIEQLTEGADFLVDGTDNFETRYLINDLAVKTSRPWVYGGVIATYGMTMTIIPGETACLRCVFPDAPDAGSAPTCDTAGVFGPSVHVVSSLEASEAIKLALGRTDAITGRWCRSTSGRWSCSASRSVVRDRIARPARSDSSTSSTGNRSTSRRRSAATMPCK